MRSFLIWFRTQYNNVYEKKTYRLSNLWIYLCWLSRNVAFQLVKKGIDVIIDEGFWEKEQRVKMKNRIEALGAKEVLYYLDTPIETIRERVVGRNVNLTKESFKINREMLDNYLKYWQAPTEDEDYVLASEVK